MADTIPEFYSTEFAANWIHLAQQMDVRLLPHVMADSFTGKEKRYQQLGSQAMQRVTERKSDTEITDPSLTARWLRYETYDLANDLDELDEKMLGEVVLPTSAYAQSHAMAYNRAVDSVIITALLGNSYTGSTGTTPVALTQSIAVNYVETGSAADSNLTIGKMRRAKEILDSNEVPSNDRALAIGSNQLRALLRSTEVTSADYNTIRALVQGELNTFLGFTIVRTEQLPEAAGNVRSCIAFQKSGIQFAVGERRSYIDRIPTKRHKIQIRSVACVGAIRMEESKVVEILADEDL